MCGEVASVGVHSRLPTAESLSSALGNFQGGENEKLVSNTFMDVNCLPRR
jgi:hypothetical protein